MKKALFGLLVLAITSGAVLAQEAVDKTLAVVNGEPLMSSEYNKIATPIIEQQRMAMPASEQTEAKLNELKNKILEEKVNQILLVQEAKKSKIKVVKREIDEALLQVKKRFPNEAAFTEELKKEGLTQIQFEKKLEEQLMSMRFIEGVMKSKVKQPSEDDVKKFYDNVRKKMAGEKLGLAPQDEEVVAYVANLLKRMSSEQVRLRQIFVKCPKNSTPEELKAAQNRVANIKKELLKGQMSFADLSEKYSEDNILKQRKGDMGLVVKGDLAKEIDGVVFNLNVGEWTKDAVKTDFGYHFLRVEEKKAASVFTFDDVKKDLGEVLYQQNMKKAYDVWIAELRAKASIKINQIW
jgi:parvulin-like peptidyl-prolyl isomerase